MVHTAYLADEEGRLIINGKPSRIVLVKKPPLAAVVMVPRVYAGWSITVGNELLGKLSSQFAINPDEMMCHIKHVAAYREWRSPSQKQRLQMLLLIAIRMMPKWSSLL